MFGFNPARMAPVSPEYTVTTPTGWTFEFGGPRVAIRDEDKTLLIVAQGHFLRDMETCMALEDLYRSAHRRGVEHGKAAKLAQIKHALEI